MSVSPLYPLSQMRLVSAPAWLSLNTALQVMGAIMGLLGQWFVNHQNPIGYVFWLGSNAVLLWLQLRVRLFILVALHAVYFSLCVHGFLIWVR